MSLLTNEHLVVLERPMNIVERSKRVHNRHKQLVVHHNYHEYAYMVTIITCT